MISLIMIPLATFAARSLGKRVGKVTTQQMVESGILNKFLIEVFKNEHDYPYLKKIYDSKELGYSHHVKVFEIDIEYYTNLKNI